MTAVHCRKPTWALSVWWKSRVTLNRVLCLVNNTAGVLSNKLSGLESVSPGSEQSTSRSPPFGTGEEGNESGSPGDQCSPAILGCLFSQPLVETTGTRALKLILVESSVTGRGSHLPRFTSDLFIYLFIF